MTLGKAVDRFDLLYPNRLPLPLKVDLVSRLEGRINREILALYGEEDPDFRGYDAVEDEAAALKVHFPFDDVYLKFLAAENDLLNGDSDRYRNSAALFNSAWESLTTYYNRTRRIKASARMTLG